MLSRIFSTCGLAEELENGGNKATKTKPATSACGNVSMFYHKPLIFFKCVVHISKELQFKG